MNSGLLFAADRRVPVFPTITARCSAFVVTAVTLVSGTVAAAEQHASAARAVNDIFGGDQLMESAFTIHQTSRLLSPGERFDFLWQHVLPGPGHADLRLRVSFTPTHPVLFTQEGDNRTDRPGGQLVSPALDLIDMADRLGKLSQLEQRLIELPNAAETDARVPTAETTTV